ncbi:MAG: VOC family protein [Candidatus Sumerlaeaceae bacterium]|nr:VOC family protein [Candidatus Sumerlaeaceae bacterium]
MSFESKDTAAREGKGGGLQINPYLFFNGNCEAAFTYYAEILGGTIVAMLPHEGTPAAEQVPAEWLGKVLHAKLKIGDQFLMASDAPPGRFAPPQGFSVNINIESPQEAERIFEALAKDGKVTMPIGQTFWALRFGMLVDQFGTPWMINCQEAS